MKQKLTLQLPKAEKMIKYELIQNHSVRIRYASIEPYSNGHYSGSKFDNVTFISLINSNGSSCEVPNYGFLNQISGSEVVYIIFI